MAMILIGGLPLAGKSTVAKRLVERLHTQGRNALWIDADLTRRFLYGALQGQQANLTERLPPEAFTPTWHAQTYAAMYTMAQVAELQGTLPVVSGNFAPPPNGAMPTFVIDESMQRYWLEVPIETLRVRLLERRKQGDPLGYSGFDDPAFIEQFLPDMQAMPIGWKTYDAVQNNAEEIVTKIITNL